MPAGRPVKFDSVDELQKLVAAYFVACEKRTRQIVTKKGEVLDVIDPEPYTMSGLAYALGMDRRTLLEYGKKEIFSPTIKRAKDKVHRDVERRLMETNPTGAIFNLKNNFEWKDKTEVEAENKNTNLNVDYEGGVVPESFVDNFMQGLKQQTAESADDH